MPQTKQKPQDKRSALALSRVLPQRFSGRAREDPFSKGSYRSFPSRRPTAADRIKNTAQAIRTRLVPCFALKVFGESARGPFFKRVLSFPSRRPTAADKTKNTVQAIRTHLVPCFALKVFGESARGPFFQKGPLVPFPSASGRRQNKKHSTSDPHSPCPVFCLKGFRGERERILFSKGSSRSLPVGQRPQTKQKTQFKRSALALSRVLP